MASNEWLVRKLHEQDKKIEALSRGGTGVGHSSIAPGENLTVISDNGEVVLGAGGVEHVDGPTPATPSAPTLKLGFGTIETTWDGTFAEGEDEDGIPLVAPVDFDAVEVHCSTDPEEEEWGDDTRRGQIKTREGGTITVGGFDVDDEVFVCLIALAKTGKRSAPSATASLVIEGLDFSQLFTEIDAANATIKNAGEVLVTEQGTLNDKLSDAFGQIEDAITSANGKNVVHYEDAPPTVDDPGVEGDTWFVGQVGRNEELLATNLATNPSMTSLNNILGPGQISPSSGTATIVTAEWAESGGTALKIFPTSSNNTTAADVIERYNFTDGPQYGGRTFTISANFHMESAQSGSLWSNARRIVVRAQETGSSVNQSFALSPQAPNAAGDTRLSVTFTLPAQLDYWYVLFSNGSSSVPVYWDSVDIAEAPSARPYFDGDTEDGATDDDPHYRWTGEPHASTSEKYLPATEGLSSNWNVTEQYRFVNGSWENVELSHTVLSSLDLGKLVAGSAAIKEAVVQKLWAEVVVTKMAVAQEFIGENAILTGAVTAPKITASEELWAKIAQFVKIRAEHIEADAIDGMVITGATIQSAATGARVQMSASGIESYNDTNERTFYAEASSGNVYMVGSFYSNEQGQPRVEIDNDDWANIPVIDDTGTTQYVNGAGIRIGSDETYGFSIYHGASSAGGNVVQNAAIKGPLGNSMIGLAENGAIHLKGLTQNGQSSIMGVGNMRGQGTIGDTYMGTYDNGVLAATVRTYGTGVAHLQSRNASGSLVGSVATSSSSGATMSTPASTVSVEPGGSVNVTVDHAAGGRFRVNSVWGVTSSSGSQVRVNSDGTLYRDGSSERYKQDIADAPTFEDILNIAPRVWRERSAVEAAERLTEFRETVEIGPVPRELGYATQNVPWHFGAVAEELDNLGLKQFVQYDEYGRPDGIDYDRIGVALIPIVRDLRDRIEELEGQTHD